MKSPVKKHPLRLFALVAVASATLTLSACSDGDDDPAPQPEDVPNDAPADGDPAAPQAPGSTPDTPGSTPDTPGSTPDTPGSTPDTPGSTPDTPGSTPDTPGVTPDTPPTTPSGTVIGTFDKVGTVNVTNISSSTAGGVFETSSAFGSFSQLSQSVTVTSSDLLLFPDVDQCSVAGSSIDDLDTNPDLDQAGVTSSDISAGQVLTLTSQFGTYASLNKIQDADSISYSVANVGASPVGLSLVLDIPGDQYPAVAGLSLPEFAAVPPTLNQQLASISSNPNLQWTPLSQGSNSDSVLFITAFAFDQATSSVTGFTCFITDDGDFTLPADVINSVGPAFSPISASSFRLSYSWFDVGGGAALLYFQTAGDTFIADQQP